VDTFGASGLIGMNGVKSIMEVGDRVLLKGSKSQGLSWKHVLWETTYDETIDALKKGKIIGKIVEMNPSAQFSLKSGRPCKVRIEEPYTSHFEYCDLSFMTSDLEPIASDFLEDVDFDL
jgi:hypothetical protein